MSGVAATGTRLAGEVTIKDSSSERKEKATVIANDGSFSLDVSDLQAPYLLRVSGTADGVSHTLYSFAGGPGTANVNPLSSVAGQCRRRRRPATVFDEPDPATLDKIKSGLADSIAALQTKLEPLLTVFDAAGKDPVNGSYVADHDGLDGMFDNVKIVLENGTLTITNANTGAVIFTA